KFARLGKAQVIPFTQKRLEDGSGYRLVIHPPLADFPGESEEAGTDKVNPGRKRWPHPR
ncbi:lipid A biosynthesis lauroyl acyltransferase, partial [Pseudomonas putida]